MIKAKKHPIRKKHNMYLLAFYNIMYSQECTDIVQIPQKYYDVLSCISEKGLRDALITHYYFDRAVGTNNIIDALKVSYEIVRKVTAIRGLRNSTGKPRKNIYKLREIICELDSNS
jgi:hypothetical protein